MQEQHKVREGCDGRRRSLSVDPDKFFSPEGFLLGFKKTTINLSYC